MALGDMLISIRASSDQWAADLKKMQRDVDAFRKGVDAMEPGLDRFARKSKEASERFSHDFGEARSAAMTLEQMIGIHLPASFNKLIAESRSLGPILAGAFSGIAVLGLIQALSQVPAAIEKMSEAITGWDEKSKKAFQNFIDDSKKATDAAEDFKIKLLETQAISLQGSQKELFNQTILEKQIHDKTVQMDGVAASIKKINDGLEAQKKIAKELEDLHLGDVGAAVPMLSPQEQTQLLGFEAQHKTLNEELLALTRQRAVAGRTLNEVVGVEAVKAAKEAKDALDALFKKLIAQQEERKKNETDYVELFRKSFRAESLQTPIQVTEGLKLNQKIAEAIIARAKEHQKIEKETAEMMKKYADFWTEQEAKFRNATFTGGPEVQEGLAKAQANANAIIDKFNEGEKIVDDFAASFSRMFAAAVAQSESFWDGFKALGKSAIAAIADTFIVTMIKGVLKQWEDSFADWAKRFKDWIGKNTQLLALAGGGAAIGGAIGGKSGAVAGGAAGAALGFALTGNFVAAGIAGVVALGAALTGMFGTLRKQADKFVQTIQDPMSKAVADLFTGLEAARTTGELTVRQVTQAKASFEKMWTDFQTQAAAAGIVGQQALQTMTPFIASWREWLDGLEAAGKLLEDQAQTMAFMAQVQDAAKGIENLDLAISTLQDTGVTAAQIIEFLGGDVMQFVQAAKALDIAIPAGVAGIYDLMHAMERLAEIDRDLETTMSSLADAFNRKLNLLESAINSTQQAISDWSDELLGIWQTFTTKRADMEKEISTLEDKIARDALVKALDRAKAAGKGVSQLIQTVTEGISAEGHRFITLNQSFRDFGGNQAAIDQAQSALDAFDAQQSEKAMRADIERLNYLKTNLPAVIAQQQASAKAAIELGLALPTDPLLEELDSAKKRTAELKTLIPLEYQRLEALYKDRDATEAVMRAMGIARENEWDDVNKTILSLQSRGALLEAERNAIVALNPELGKMTDWFKRLGETMSRVGTEAAAPAIPIQQVSAAIPNSNTSAGFSLPAIAYMLFGGMPSYQHGTDFVPYTGMFQLHKGEAVVPADEPRGVTVQVHIDGNVIGNDSFVRTIVRETVKAVKRGQTLTATEIKR